MEPLVQNYKEVYEGCMEHGRSMKDEGTMKDALSMGNETSRVL